MNQSSLQQTGLFQGQTLQAQGCGMNGSIGAYQGALGGYSCIPNTYYYYSYPQTQTIYLDDPQKLNVKRVENGFIITYQSKTYVSTEAKLPDLIAKLLSEDK